MRLFYVAGLEGRDDISYYAWLSDIWAIPEMGSGILAASLPSTRVFVQHVAQSKLLSNIVSSFRLATPRGAGGRSNLPDTYQKVHESSSYRLERPAPGIRVERSWRNDFDSGSDTGNDTLGNLSEYDVTSPINTNSAHNLELSTLSHNWMPVGHCGDTAA